MDKKFASSKSGSRILLLLQLMNITAMTDSTFKQIQDYCNAQ